MNRAAVEPLRIAPPAPADLASAISLSLAHLSQDDLGRQTSHWTEAVKTSQAAAWAGYRDNTLAAAMLVAIQPGRTAMLLVPRVASGHPGEIANRLLEAVVADLARNQFALAQVLLEVDHGADAELLLASGFRHATDLMFLVSLAEAFSTSQPAEGLEFVVYATIQHARFAGIVEQTYAGSLDCPQLDNVRNTEDVLAGYRAVGVFDPARWMIVRQHAHDVGCLLIADQPTSNAHELVYLGIVPAARGRGLGVAVVRHAQWLARQAGRERVMTAVDAANWPAIAAYAAAGFIAWDKRSVFLRTF